VKRQIKRLEERIALRKDLISITYREIKELRKDLRELREEKTKERR